MGYERTDRPIADATGRPCTHTPFAGPARARVNPSAPPDLPKHRAWPRLKGIFSARNGATSLEYGLIISLIFLVMLAGARAMGQNTTDSFNRTANTIASTAS